MKRRARRLQSFVVTLALLSLLTALQTRASSPDSMAGEIQRLLWQSRHPFLQYADFAKEQTAIASFYRQRGYMPAWLNASRLIVQASALLDVMRSAEEFGLDPRSYEAAWIVKAADSASDSNTRAAVDLAISIAAVRLVNHLHFGRVDPQASGFDMPQRSALDFTSVLSRLATATDVRVVLASIEPPFRHYRTLKSALATYRKLASRPQIQLPPLPKISVKPGETYAGTAQLKALLIALGDLPASSTGGTDQTIDAQLVGGLKNFQSRHGLRQDGVLGAATFAQLTTPLAHRVRQIELTLERWRWLPALDAPTIFVNIPQFRLFAFPTKDDDETQMVMMDVIVGTFPRTRTPAFAADMKYVKFRPYWDVPYSIMKSELLPQLRKNPLYLEQHDMEIVAGQGDDAIPLAPTAQAIESLAAGRLRVRQRPGANNPLGAVKFMLPNRYNVYLHATSAPELFNEFRRAFSHGCIRVRDPVGLAEYVLRNAPGEWTRERIEVAMHGPDNQRVALERSIRVLVLYGTAVATEAQRVYFFDDVYGNDERLERLLAVS